MSRISVKTSESKKQSNKSSSTAKHHSGISLASPIHGTQPVSISPLLVQAKLVRKSSSEDKYEREANELSQLVVKNISDYGNKNKTEVSQNTTGKILQRKSENVPHVSGLPSLSNGISVGQDTVQTLSRRSSNGNSISATPRAEMETGFGADFSQVRIHTDREAVKMNQEIGAKAFTYGSDIYFNQGMYAPDSDSGRLLLAHELTHILQQRAAKGIQRKTEEEEDGILDDIISFFAKYADDIPGYSLVSVIIGYDIVRGKRVLRTPENFLKGIFGLLPGGNALYTALVDNGILEKAFSWMNEKVIKLNLSFSRIKVILTKIWEESGWAGLVTGQLLDLVKNEFLSLKERILSFGREAMYAIFTLLKEALITPLLKLAQKTKGYTLLTKVLGQDPISGEKVEATTEEILIDFLLLLGKEQELEEMKKRGSLKRTAKWLDRQKETFVVLFSELKGAFTDVWDSFVLEDWLLNPLEKLHVVIERFKGPVLKFVEFGWTVAKKVLKFIKDALLKWLGTYLKENLRGFKLLTVILGKDPITGEEVERSGENLILGFLSLILPDDRIQEIQKTGAIQQTIDWIMTKVGELGISWDAILQLFYNIWNTVSIEDLIEPVKTFGRIMAKFGEPIMKIINFVKEVVFKVVEVILQIMQFPVDVVKSIIANAQQAYEDIEKDPVRFLLNILDAVKLGFSQFFENIGAHLLNGVKAWFFKQLEKAGITPPEDLSLSSILKLVMEILGVTMEKIFAKIEKKIGKEKMDKIRAMGEKVMGIWSFINDIITGGPATIWDKIQEQLSNLWDMVTGFVRDWITENIINKVVTKLLSMLDPTGIMAVINSVMALYDSIRSAIEYFTEMLMIVNSFVVGVGEIAKGSLSRAADYLEKALGDGMPVAIGYLANLIGLDNLADKLREILVKVRVKVDEAIDWLIDKAIELGSSLLQAGKDALGKLKEWWQAKKEFRADDGEKHTLFFKGSEENVVLMIASEEQKFKDFISEIEVGDDKDKEKAKIKALAILGKIDEIKQRSTGAETKEEVAKNRAKKQKDLQRELDKLSPHVAKLFGIIGPLPDSEIKYHTVNIGGKAMGDKMEASILTKEGPDGSAPKEDHPVFTELLARREGGRSYYIRGHLLNDNIHGPGEWINMTILSQKGNKNHLEVAEKTIKDAVQSGSVVSYTVDVVYGRKDLTTNDTELERVGIDKSKWEDIKKVRALEKHVPSALNVQADILTQNKSGKFVRKKALVKNAWIINLIDHNLANYEVGKGKPQKTVSLTNSSVEEIAENTGQEPSEIKVIQKAALKVEKLDRYDKIIAQMVEDKTVSNILIFVVKELQAMKNVKLN